MQPIVASLLGALTQPRSPISFLLKLIVSLLVCLSRRVPGLPAAIDVPQLEADVRAVRLYPVLPVDYPAIVHLVWTNGVNHYAILQPAVAQRLCIIRVQGDIREKLRHQGGQGI